MRTRNLLGLTRELDRSWWDGTTGLDPVDTVVRRVLRHGYAHHIERLMVLGNAMLLLRTDPDEVYEWFMTFFVDAYDWVMVPNVYAMSQFAAGELVTTKPYVSGSNYLRKMSDFGPGRVARGLGRALLAVRRRPPRRVRVQPAQQLRGADLRPDGRLPQARAGRGGGRVVGPLMDTLRTPEDRFAALPGFGTAVVRRGPGRGRRHAADGVRRDRAGGRPGGAAAARGADLVVPLPPRDAGARRRRHPGRRAGPGRVRPLRQARPAGRPHATPGTSSGCGRWPSTRSTCAR